MATKTCTACAGTGRSVKVTSGHGFARDYDNLCSTCGGSGTITVPDPKPQNRGGGNGGGNTGGSGCASVILLLIIVTLALIF